MNNCIDCERTDVPLMKMLSYYANDKPVYIYRCCACEKIRCENRCLKNFNMCFFLNRLDLIKKYIALQAEDESLWFLDQTAPEHYLQTALRKLHFIIEEATEEQAKDLIKKYKLELHEAMLYEDGATK